MEMIEEANQLNTNEHDSNSDEKNHAIGDDSQLVEENF